jgi:5-methylcytosine-specific restriction protein B
MHGQPYSAPLADRWVNHQGSTIDIRLMLEKMNERIETLYDRDHTIGHAYFTPLWDASEADRFGELAEIFRNRIIPLLEEYFFEDWQKIRLVLGDNQKLQSAQFVTVKDDQESDLASLFGSDHGVDMYSSRRRFRLDDSAFHKSDAYLGIYE